jgi:hypothetical protein
MSAYRQSNRVSNPHRTHYESRARCRECKRRHVKCDERLQHRVNCSVSHRHCEYASPTLTSHPDESLPTTRTPGACVDRGTSPNLNESSIRSNSRSPRFEDGQAFTLKHMQLLDHVEHGITTWLGATDVMVPLVEQYIKTTITTPYLMDQLLALSALHLSHTTDRESARYRSLATELQTRGLSLFNARGDDADKTACWYFSSLLAMHHLAIILVDHHQQDEVLLEQRVSPDALIQSYRLTFFVAFPRDGFRNWSSAVAEADKLILKLNLTEKNTILTEKISLFVGGCVGNILPIERVGFNGLCLQDGPNGINLAHLVNVFPSGVTVGTTWDREMFYQHSKMVGAEHRAKAVNIGLG